MPLPLLLLQYISQQKGSFWYKACAAMLTWFFIHASDYIVSYTLIMLFGKSADVSIGIQLILNPGTNRLVYILVNKSLQIALFLAFSKFYIKLKLLNKKSIILLFSVTTLSYIVMSILTNLILTGSLLALQIAVIFSLFLYL